MIKFFLVISMFGIALVQAQVLDEIEWSEPGDEPNEVVIFLMGDVNIQNRKDPTEAFKYLHSTLDQADLRFCNLEGPFAGAGLDINHPDIPHKPAWTHSDPAMVEGLVGVGMDVVGVANNVTFPSAALLRSLKVLDERGIRHTGGGLNKDEATKPVIMEINGAKIAFIQYACTVFPFDHAASATQPGIAGIKISTSYLPPRNLDKPGQPPIVLTQIDEESLMEMKGNIEKASEEADLVITSYHWGVSNEYEPHPYQREIARAAIEAGADIVFGHGAHKIQIIESWQDKPIFYCSGNSVFDWWKVRGSEDGLLARIVLKNKELWQVSFVPMHREGEDEIRICAADKGIGKKITDKLMDYASIHRARLIRKGHEVEVFHRNRNEEIPKLDLLWKTEGFSKPESVVFDSKRNVIYVGNINGDSPSGGFDGDGFISRVNFDGTIQNLKWITGLDDPKGMDLQDDTLWVNDRNKVVKVNVASGKIIKKFIIPQAVFLNDISVSPDGLVFTNDADGHQTFWLKEGEFQTFWVDLEKGRPNGIWAEENRLLVATSNSHKLISIDRRDRKNTLMAEDIGRGDGIEGIGYGDYFLSDYTGRIFYLSPLGYTYTILDNRNRHFTADFEFIPGSNQLIVPTHKGNTVIGYQVSWPKNQELGEAH